MLYLVVQEPKQKSRAALVFNVSLIAAATKVEAIRKFVNSGVAFAGNEFKQIVAHEIDDGTNFRL